ncbi:hypothetical protein [Coleofasciculus sp. FACHB-SPT9]|uniref:hypothetical protein n=1 Tax=Cyanophyceae TaxID=3028117 RepID=UPI0016883EE6|nr:hypothetical protein [Coleofasciculus sp. FACHB-SPT9]MBD1892372.1 hypothetical protein [Coleofasciculus sp. FACHB-SPT9]
MKEKTYYGEEAIATDPINPNIVYMAAGKYSQRQPKGSIFKSTERGKNWTKLNINLGIDSNVEHCWVGKRLALNPANSNIIFFDSRHDGVWRSSNAGATMGESRFFFPNAYQRALASRPRWRFKVALNLYRSNFNRRWINLQQTLD